MDRWAMGRRDPTTLVLLSDGPVDLDHEEW
jgi:hypothetical protein